MTLDEIVPWARSTLYRADSGKRSKRARGCVEPLGRLFLALHGEFKMLRRTLTILVGLAALAPITALGERDREGKSLRVYFVGNSVTDTINYRALAELAKSRGHRQIWGRHMIPGAPLQWIWEHPRDGFQEQPFGHYPNALANYPWDVLSLQPFDRHLTGKDGDLAVAKKFIDLALPKSPDLQVYVYARWPRQGKDEFDTAWLKKYTGGWDGTNETQDYFERLTLELRKAYPQLNKPILMVPVGHVMYELDQRMKAGKVPGYKHIKEVFADGIHLNNIGSYIVGCTFFATLYKENPQGLPSEPYKLTDPKLAEVIQETVWKVVSAHELSGVGTGRKASYAPSPAIRNLTLDSKRQSLGDGDNWPITWADDGELYTVYCDGKGFGGGSGEGSMSLAKITGSPPNITGENIASTTGHKTGGGAEGRKASGLLMVEGVLYMWVRNLKNDGTGSSLAWSKDHAKTWTWAEWNFPEIGYPVWMNAGRNYQAAQDDYAYMYSPDTPSAYKTSDQILLARVPKDKITQKDAYEFFAGLNEGGEPRWADDFQFRKPVFLDRGHCYRPEVVYNPGLKNYLLCTATSGALKWCGTNEKYLGIFDGPTPWGPWTAVKQVSGWGGDENRFQPRIPAKWISEDGKSFCLLYSCFPKGPYKFNVQRCALDLAEKE